MTRQLQKKTKNADNTTDGHNIKANAKASTTSNSPNNYYYKNKSIIIQN